MLMFVIVGVYTTYKIDIDFCSCQIVHTSCRIRPNTRTFEKKLGHGKSQQIYSYSLDNTVNG